MSLHRHEKRHGLIKDVRALSCLIYRVTPPGQQEVKPLLDYTMKYSYCIVCNAKHWILGERIVNEPVVRKFHFMERTGYE